LYANVKNQDAIPDTQGTKSDPIIIEQARMRMTIAHRLGVSDNDEELTFDITTACPEEKGKRILRFDCFTKTRIITSVPGEHSVHNMKDEGVEDPVRWTLDQIKTRFRAIVKQSGYEQIAEKIEQQAIADQLIRLEAEILAKY
jgi:hypothetical protein